MHFILSVVLSLSDTIVKLAIPSKQASTMSNRSTPRRPSIKAKPPNLQGILLDHPDQDWLNENLLEDGDNVPSPTRRSADLPRQLDSHDLGPYRLVIAIDYGTTFTGEQSLVAIVGVS
jgi:hypothetical protein